MTDTERELDCEKVQAGQPEESGFGLAAGPMSSNAPSPRLVFLHSSFRASSTWFWSKFRSFAETECYREVLGEDVATITTEKVFWADAEGWDSRHPSRDPYYLEYLPLIHPNGGVQFFDPAMPMDWFFPIGGLRGELREAEIRYLSLLVDHARQRNKVPVFGGTNSLGRLWSIKNSFGGFHVFLHRNLWKQWLSYLYYRRRKIYYFYETTARVVGGSGDPFVAELADFYVQRAVDYRPSSALSRRPASAKERLDLLLWLPESDAFAMFMALHIYLYLHAQKSADLTVDVTKLARDPEHRSGIEKTLAQQAGFEISLSDVTDEQGRGIAIGAQAIDWDEIREHARGAAQALSAFANPNKLFDIATQLIDAAMEELRKSEAARAPQSDTSEEIWFGRLQEARCRWALGDDGAFLREALALFNACPDRAEPLYELARFHRERGMHETAMHFAEAGLALAPPDDGAKFVENLVYQWGLKEEISIAGFYCRDLARRERGAAACNWLARNSDIPAEMREQAQQNLQFYVQPAAEVHAVPEAAGRFPSTASRGDTDRNPRILFYSPTNWSGGAVHNSLAAQLRAVGWVADIKDWRKSYVISELAKEVLQYDYVLTMAGDGAGFLMRIYGIAPEKIIVVAHAESDLQRMISADGTDSFDRYPGYGVVSDTLASSSITLGIRRVPFVVRLGVDFAKYRHDISARLSSVGYPAFMSRLTLSGIEQKRGPLARACAEAAGLRFAAVDNLSLEKMPDFYGSVDSVVMPSLHEGAGLPPLEGAAAGRLVIGTPVGHFPRLAYEGLGILAPLEAEAFQRFTTETLIYYRDNPSAYVEKCAAIQEAAKQRDWQCIVNDWIELISNAR
jgi:hypothetical protein